MYHGSVIVLICTAILFCSCVEPSTTDPPIQEPSEVNQEETVIPDAPDNLELDAVSGATLLPSVELDWTDNSDNEDGFNIERSESAEFSDVVSFSTDADVKHFLDKGVTPELPYYYRVRAYTGEENSDWCETETITYFHPLPAAPSEAIAARVSDTSCQVVWTDNAYNETDFTIEYSLNSDFSTPKTTTVGEDKNSCTLEHLNSNDYYYVRVCAVNSTGNSGWSNTAEVDLTIPVPPVAPSNATAVKLGNNCFRLEWSDNSPNETGFRLEYSTNSDFSNKIVVNGIGVDEESYILDELTLDGTYYARVRSYNGTENSNWAETGEIDLAVADANSLTVAFTDGVENSGYQKVYTVWMEDGSGFFRNINVCTRIKAQDLSGTALPYWQIKKRNPDAEDEIDAITSATVKTGNFKKYASLDGAPDKFTVCFEIDHSYDGNDWFDDQPAILYRIEVDLSSSTTDYSVTPDEPAGWTPNENTNSYTNGENYIPDMNIDAGELQETPGYIIYQNDGDDSYTQETLDDRRATDLVGALKITINN